MYKKAAKSNKDKLFNYLVFYCIYSLPVCGIISAPGIFFHWWETYISTVCAGITVLSITMLVVIGLYLRICSAKRKSRPFQNEIRNCQVGRARFLSDEIYINEIVENQGAETVLISPGEYNINQYFDDDQQIGILVFSLSETPVPLLDIISDDEAFPSKSVVVDSGDMFLFSKNTIKLSANESVRSYDNYQCPLSLEIIDKKYSSLKIDIVYGDGDYRIKSSANKRNNIFIIETICDSFETYQDLCQSNSDQGVEQTTNNYGAKLE